MKKLLLLVCVYLLSSAAHSPTKCMDVNNDRATGEQGETQIIVLKVAHPQPELTSTKDFDDETFRHFLTAPNDCKVYMCYYPEHTGPTISSKWYIEDTKITNPITNRVNIATCDLENGILISKIGALPTATIDREINALFHALTDLTHWGYKKFFVWVSFGNPDITALNGTLTDRLATPLFTLLTTKYGFVPGNTKIKNAFGWLKPLQVPDGGVQLEANYEAVNKGLS